MAAQGGLRGVQWRSCSSGVSWPLIMQGVVWLIMFRLATGVEKAVMMSKDKMVIKSIADGYIEGVAGVTGTKGKLLNALMEEKSKERSNPSDSIRTKSQEQA
jgi:hypothetical protein